MPYLTNQWVYFFNVLSGIHQFIEPLALHWQNSIIRNNSVIVLIHRIWLKRLFAIFDQPRVFFFNALSGIHQFIEPLALYWQNSIKGNNLVIVLIHMPDQNKKLDLSELLSYCAIWLTKTKRVKRVLFPQSGASYMSYICDVICENPSHVAKGKTAK